MQWFAVFTNAETVYGKVKRFA